MKSSGTGVRVALMGPEHPKQVLAIYWLGIDEATPPSGHRPTWEAEALGRADVAPTGARAPTPSRRSGCVHRDAGGPGVGIALLTAVPASADASGIWIVQSGIFRQRPVRRRRQLRGFSRVGVRIVQMSLSLHEAGSVRAARRARPFSASLVLASSASRRSMSLRR